MSCFMDDDHDVRMGILRSALDSPYWKTFVWRGTSRKSGMCRGTGYYVLFEGTLPLYVGKTSQGFFERLMHSNHPIRNRLKGRVTHVCTIKAPEVSEAEELKIELDIKPVSNKQKYKNKCHHNFHEVCWKELEYLRQHGPGSGCARARGGAEVRAKCLLKEFGMLTGWARHQKLTEFGQTATKQDLQDCIDEFFRESWPHPPAEEAGHHNGWVLSGGWA